MSSPNLDHIRLSDAVEGGRISNGRNEDPQGFQSFSLISPTGSESGSEDRGGGEGGGLDEWLLRKKATLAIAENEK